MPLLQMQAAHGRGKGRHAHRGSRIKCQIMLDAQANAQARNLEEGQKIFRRLEQELSFREAEREPTCKVQENDAEE